MCSRCARSVLCSLAALGLLALAACVEGEVAQPDGGAMADGDGGRRDSRDGGPASDAAPPDDAALLADAEVAIEPDAGPAAADASMADAGALDAAADAGTIDPGERDAGDAATPLTRPDPVATMVTAGVLEQIVPIGVGLIAADYSRVLDLLVWVSAAQPQTLTLYDLAEDALYEVALPAAATAISVAPDGLRAAVGHAGAVTVVDLTTAGVVRTYPVAVIGSDEIADVVLAGNGYAYIAAKHNGWTALVALDLESGSVQPNTGTAALDGGSHLVLHPSGERIYSYSAMAGPIVGWDIRAGVASLVHESSRDASYAQCGELIATEEEDRLLDGCAIFASDPDVGRDLLYRGVLEVPFGVTPFRGARHVDQSAAVHGLVALVAPATTGVVPAAGDAIAFYEDRYATAQRLTDLPPFTIGGTSRPARGRFVFFTSDGERALALVQTPPDSSGTSQPFGLIVVERGPAGGSVIAPADQPALAPAPGATPLDAWVLNAEYSVALDRIVAVTREPSRLLLIDALTGQQTTVALPLRPIGVSVAPDGLTAAVSHAGWVSLVDLRTATVAQVRPVSAAFVDIVLGGNGHVYGYLGTEVNQSGFHDLSLADGVESRAPFEPVLAPARLHPSGQRIYTTSQWPNEWIGRQDLGAGTLPPLRRPLVEVESGACGSFAFSPDGDCIFTACGAVLHSADALERDMQRAGSFANPFSEPLLLLPFRALDYSAEAGVQGMLVAVPQREITSTPRYDTIAFYDEPFLNPYAVRAVPALQLGGAAAPADAHHVFFSSDGGHTYVLLEARAMLNRRFGLATFATPAARDPLPAPSPPFATSYAGFEPLDHRVLAAAFSETRDALLTISDAPPALHIMNPVTHAQTVVSLPLAPTSLALNPAGTRAAIGHDGYISLVDLASATRLETVPVPVRAQTLAFADGDRAYAMRTGSRIYGLDFASDALVTSSYASTLDKTLFVRSDSKVLYVASSSIDRFDVSAGPIGYLDTVTTVTSSQLCGNPPIAASANRFMTRCGYVLESVPGPVAQPDVTVLGRLAGISSVAATDYSAARDRFATVESTDYGDDQTVLHVHGGDFAELASSALPAFHVAARQYPATARHVFLDSAGTTAHVIVQAPPSAQLGRDFALTSVAVP